MAARARRTAGRHAQTVRTTLALPAGLLEAVDRIVRSGGARSRNALVAQAVRRELAAQRRREIDAAFADMGRDDDVNREVLQIAGEFAQSDWEALRLADKEP